MKAHWYLKNKNLLRVIKIETVAKNMQKLGQKQEVRQPDNKTQKRSNYSMDLFFFPC